MTRHDRQLASHALAPVLLLIAVAVAIVVQLGAPLPIAGAVALAAWGTVLAGGASRGRIVLALAVYVPLTLLAIGSQLDAASAAGQARQFIAAMDSGAAVALLIQLARRL
jgi:hypothetical protein